MRRVVWAVIAPEGVEVHRTWIHAPIAQISRPYGSALSLVSASPHDIPPLHLEALFFIEAQVSRTEYKMDAILSLTGV